MSYTESVLNRICNSNILYPSNYECIIDKTYGYASFLIEDYMHDITKILDRTPKGWMHSFGKPIRAVLRGGCFFAGSLVASPLGLVYNSSQTILHGAKSLNYYRLGDKANAKEELMRMANAAGAAFIDGYFTFITYSVLGTGLALAHIVTPINPQANLKLIATTAIFFYTLIGAVPSGLAWYKGIFDQGKEFFQETILKNEFGICNPDGTVLKTVDAKKDLDLMEELYEEKIHLLLHHISGIQRDLPLDKHIPFHNPLNEELIIQHLQDNAEFITPRDGITAQQISMEWIEAIKISAGEYRVVRNIFNRLVGTHNKKFSEYSDEYYKKFFDCEIRKTFDVGKLFAQTQDAIVDTEIKIWELKTTKDEVKRSQADELKCSIESLPKEYRELRPKIRTSKKELTLLEVFNLKPEFTFNDVKRAYSKLALITHSDKLKIEWNECLKREMNEAFIFIDAVYKNYVNGLPRTNQTPSKVPTSDASTSSHHTYSRPLLLTQ